MVDLSALGANTGGVWSRADALALLTPGQIATCLRRQEWQTLWPGVHADAGTAPTPRQRAWAAVLASGPGTVVSGRTAARLWGLVLVDDLDPATGAAEHRLDDVTSPPHARTLRWHGRELRRHRTRLAPQDVVRLRSGLLVTSRTRTLYDCAALLAPEALVCALDDALHRGLVTPEDLEREAAARAGQLWSGRFREAVRAADSRAESPAETLTRLLLLPHLPGLVPQVELFDRAVRLVARFDLADEQRRFAVEADGRAGHAGDLMVAKDRRRDARTAALGWTTERVSWFDVRRRQHETVARVVAAAQRVAAAA